MFEKLIKLHQDNEAERKDFILGKGIFSPKNKS